jgi:hypothetical protein
MRGLALVDGVLRIGTVHVSTAEADGLVAAEPEGVVVDAAPDHT